jgi:peptidoglycan/LPS O-acetylase OafA/YrhL
VIDAASRQKHLDYLDGWRGASIFLVLAGHFSLLPTIFGHDFYTARVGVEFFFVLSGRLMANILFINRLAIAQFYWRRFSRIFPALLWLVFALLVIRQVSISDAVLALTFTANYFTPSDPLAHVWSLCVEEHSYIILSIIAVISRHRKINVAAVLFSISAAAMANGAIQTWVFHREYSQVYWHSDVKISSVFIAAAMFLQFRKTSVPPILPLIAMAFGLILSVPYSIPDPIKYTLGTALLAFSVATIDQAWKWVTILLGSSIWRKLGTWSFSVYLWQQPFYLVQSEHPKWLLLIELFAAALFSFFLIERPARAFLNALYFKKDIEPLLPLPDGSPQ